MHFKKTYLATSLLLSIQVALGSHALSAHPASRSPSFAPGVPQSGPAGSQGKAAQKHLLTTPLQRGTAWTADGPNPNISNFGALVADVGDLNGDGFDDVGIGAYLQDDPVGSVTLAGAVHIYNGSPAGLEPTPSRVVFSDSPADKFGKSFASAEDVNGDGFDDLIVGEPEHLYTRGRAQLFLGSAQGIGSSPDWIFSPGQYGSEFGSTVSGAGDVNGDGYDDVIIGAPHHQVSVPDEGAVFLFLGSAAGLGASADWVSASQQDTSQYGSSISSAGDVNGDGFDDIVIGAPYYDDQDLNNGRIFLYLGSPSGPGSAADWTSPRAPRNSFHGFPVSGAGDVNGDGYDDILVGNFFPSNRPFEFGSAFAYYGSPTGLPNKADWRVQSNLLYSLFGLAVSDAGDLDGDGYDDVIIGAPAAAPRLPRETHMYIFRGSATGLELEAADERTRPNLCYSYGLTVSGAGDVNGDGLADVLVGQRTNPAQGYAYHGSGH